MYLSEGKIYLCKDNEVRCLDKIEPNYLYYSVPINISNGKCTWLKLSKTKRCQIEHDFVNGRFINESEILSA